MQGNYRNSKKLNLACKESLLDNGKTKTTKL